jgi:hypothetical protein
MKNPIDRDIFGFTLAQFEDWVEKSSQKMFKRYKKDRSLRISEESRGKVIPISRKTRNRLRAD